MKLKTLLLSGVCLLMAVAAVAQNKAIPEDLFFKGSLQEAKAKAKAENKRLMLMVSATFCGPCKQLERDVYPTPEFRELRDKNNLILKYYHDLDKNDPDSIHKLYKIAAYPSFIVLSPDGEETVRIAGCAASLQVFCNNLNNLLKPEGTKEARQQRLKEDPSYAYDYIQFLREAFLYKELEDTMYKLMEKGPLEDYFTEKWWQSYYNYVNYIDSGVLNFMLDHPEEVIQVIGKEKYEDFLHNRGLRMIELRVTGSNKFYDKVRAIVKFAEKHPELETTLSRFFRKNVDLAENGDGEALFNETMRWIKDADTKSRKVLNVVATSRLESLERPKLEAYMLKIAEESLKYETDPKAKAEYENWVNTMKQRAASNK